MPELPEVEVTRRGIEPFCLNAKVVDIWHDDKKLRVPYPEADLSLLIGEKINSVSRRAKYILLNTAKGSLLMHLGMTGHLRIIQTPSDRGTHDHFELFLDNGTSIRFNDIRRFGLVSFIRKDQSLEDNRFLKDLGIEPLSDGFNSSYLYDRLQRSKKNIKQTLLDGKIVVGVGNIYASESLFASGISPFRESKSITKDECAILVKQIKIILEESIKQGGTTIRDFSGANGQLGYFVQNLLVYGHEGEPCRKCGTKILAAVQGQRRTFYCPNCQK
ncbi:MAG TPA: DNA-formamidopyrimidine glycosylase [Succinivibrionaceae bacterium]|nr:DNA-formamidopyrimidine glycosylase [Succinivibrionaceae bacterium]